MALAQNGSPQEPVHCVAWDCAFAKDSGDVRCANSRCACPAGCGALQTVAEGITGAVDVQCDVASGECAVNINGVPFE